MQTEHAQAGAYVLIKLPLFGQRGWIVTPEITARLLRHGGSSAIKLPGWVAGIAEAATATRTVLS
jgi:hypothetical protein